MKLPQNMDFKGLIGKIFRNKDLAPQIQLKMALGNFWGGLGKMGTRTRCTVYLEIVSPESGACL
jgi:hypothetical protein